MTELLTQAFETARALSPALQDEIARVVLRLTDSEHEPVYILSPEEEASLAESLAQAEKGQFATDEEVRAIWAKHGL